jgi:hypothetical protein
VRFIRRLASHRNVTSNDAQLGGGTESFFFPMRKGPRVVITAPFNDSQRPPLTVLRSYFSPCTLTVAVM